MLARLDLLPGVARARAEGSGSHLALELAPGADPAAVEAAALEALRGRARRLPEAEAAAQLAARDRGDPWLSAAEVGGLSYLEARILSVRIAAEAGGRLSLPAAERARLAEAARLELFLAVEEVHRQGGRESTGWFYEAWPEVAGRIAARLAQGPGPGGPPALTEVLRALFPAR